MRESSLDPVLIDLKTKIERELGKLGPKPTFEFSDSNPGRCLVARYKTGRCVIAHANSRGGKGGKKIRMGEGPIDDGFLLRTYIQPFGDVNQAAVPQTTDRAYGALYIQVYEIEKQKKQIYFCLSYTPRTDPKLIRKLRTIAEQCGTPHVSELERFPDGLSSDLLGTKVSTDVRPGSGK